MTIWSKEPPKRDGFYWVVCDAGGRPVPARVFAADESSSSVFMDLTQGTKFQPVPAPGKVPPGWAGFLWWGPKIEEPKWPDMLALARALATAVITDGRVLDKDLGQDLVAMARGLVGDA